MCSYCGVGCGISVTTPDRRATRRSPPTVGRQAPPHERRAPVHQGRDARRPDARAGPHDHGTRAPRARRGRRRRRRSMPRSRGRRAPARDRRRARARRGRGVRVGPDVDRGAVPLEQAREGLSSGHPHRVELAAVHGVRRHRLQAVARRRRPARLVRGLRPRRPVLRHRVEHGRLPPDPVPADGGPPQAAARSSSSSTRAARRPPTAPTCSCRSPRAPTSRCSTACCTCSSRTGHIDEEFIAAHTEGWEAMPEFLAEYPPDARRRAHRHSPRTTSARPPAGSARPTSG